MKIKGWSITSHIGAGSGPDFAPTQFFTVVGTKVKTETRVDIKGLEQILPADILSEFQSNAHCAGTDASDQKP